MIFGLSYSRETLLSLRYFQRTWDESLVCESIQSINGYTKYVEPIELVDVSKNYPLAACWLVLRLLWFGVFSVGC